MSNRFIRDEDGLRGDGITAMAIDGQPIQGSRPTLSITGIMNGDDGALLVHLPGMVPRYYAFEPGADRAMRDAMIACLTDDPEQFEALQRQRYVVERTLGWLKGFRRLRYRVDRTTGSFPASGDLEVFVCRVPRLLAPSRAYAFAPCPASPP